MFDNNKKYSAVIVGGGFYGLMIAIYLKAQRGFKDVLVIEKEAALMSRASKNNQARVHSGYHYPRSFVTAFRSKLNAPRFIDQFSGAVVDNFTSIYAIAESRSKVSPLQFQRLVSEIGAPIHDAPRDIQELFSDILISKVYRTEEYVFSSERLFSSLYDSAVSLEIDFLLNTLVVDVIPSEDCTSVACEGAFCGALVTDFIFNCTYAGLNQISKRRPSVNTKLRHEITEMALIEVPAILKNLSVTVMDGPFFSLMPYPDRGLYTLSHVRYTPHCSWSDEHNVSPFLKLEKYHKNTRYPWMIRDAARYLPILKGAVYKESLFEIKTVLEKSEVDDGRPILFERSRGIKGLYSILGGKIDNVSDILQKLDSESFND